MIKAFVFGKFLPFHKGHEAMINFALTKCDFLTVLVCCSDKESLPDTVRKNWIEKTCEQHKNVEVKALSYKESELPNTSVASKDVSKVWATVFKEHFPDYSLVITSEVYGGFVAEYMNIQHIAFDIDKKLFPVSATDIKKDALKHWHFLPDVVKSFYASKVVILGTESTGKSTLSEKLSKHYKNCSLVRETGRELIPDSNQFSQKSLYEVARAHSIKIEESALKYDPLMIVDTDVHITKSYSRFAFNTELEISPTIYDSSKADLYLYLSNDAEYVQDGTRLSEIQRNLLDISHRQVLEDHNIDFVEITGDWQDRFHQAIKQIDDIIKIKQNLSEYKG